MVQNGMEWEWEKGIKILLPFYARIVGGKNEDERETELDRERERERVRGRRVKMDRPVHLSDVWASERFQALGIIGNIFSNSSWRLAS